MSEPCVDVSEGVCVRERESNKESEKGRVREHNAFKEMDKGRY